MVAATRPFDAVEYPDTDSMGEHETTINLAAELKAQIVRMLRDRRIVARVGTNQLVYFVEGDPDRYRAPDLYVIEGLTQEGPERASWKTWQGDVPSFVLEVVSSNWKKDYEDIPADYEAMGVKELVVFDPWATSRSRRRVRWQVFRRTRRGFGKPLTSSDDRIESRVLGCFLRVVTPGGNARLRVAIGPRGDTLMPTEEELLTVAEVRLRITEAQAEAERVARQNAERYALEARAEKQTAEQRAEGAEKRAEDAEWRAEQERAAKQAAEAEVARLRAEFERLRQGG